MIPNLRSLWLHWPGKLTTALGEAEEWGEIRRLLVRSQRPNSGYQFLFCRDNIRLMTSNQMLSSWIIQKFPKLPKRPDIRFVLQVHKQYEYKSKLICCIGYFSYMDIHCKSVKIHVTANNTQANPYHAPNNIRTWHEHPGKHNLNTLTETRWPTFSSRHFEMHFLEWKCINFD